MPRRCKKRRAWLESHNRPRFGLFVKLQLLSSRQSVFLADNSVSERICAVPYRASAHSEIRLRISCGVFIFQKIRCKQKLRCSRRTSVCPFGIFNLQRVLFPLSRAYDNISAAACGTGFIHIRQKACCVCNCGVCRLRCKLLLLCRTGFVRCNVLPYGNAHKDLPL